MHGVRVRMTADLVGNTTHKIESLHTSNDLLKDACNCFVIRQVKDASIALQPESLIGSLGAVDVEHTSSGSDLTDEEKKIPDRPVFAESGFQHVLLACT